MADLININALAELLAERVRPTRELIAEAVRQIVESGIMQKEWLDTAEAATYLGMSKVALEQMRKKNDGPKFYKPLPRVVRYKRSDLDAWVIKKP